MPKSQELAVQQKKELAQKEERTVPARYFVPRTDIYETEDLLTVVMEIPGVQKKDINVEVEDDVLRFEGEIDFSNYQSLEPVYSEYNVGHYARSFALSDAIDQAGISADLHDGVLTLTLKKAAKAKPRKIAIS